MTALAPSSNTIIAPATALGGGVAIIRVSGPLALRALTELTGIENPVPRLASLADFRDKNGKILDSGLALYFQGPNSFTGEDVLELHGHGGRAVTAMVLNALRALDPSIRLAEPGEFSKRAYLNGKMDLTAAEAIADLVAAETEAQAEQALAQMQGGLKTLYDAWRGQLLHLLSRLEASIDFVDEEDVPDDLLHDIHVKIAALSIDINAHLDDNYIGERLRDGFTVAVIGAPNAGKSSLVNALARREVAIVSDIAGTTRDAIEVHLNLNGFPVILIDTAGLRETTDQIEQIGIARARERAAHADITLALFDATCPRDAETLAALTPETLVVQTKGDLAQEAQSGELVISTATGLNLDRLITTLTERIDALAGRKPPGLPVLTRARHREAVSETAAHLRRAMENAVPELLAEDIRLATRALGRITGFVDVDDVLDVIFREFCIGK